MQGLWEIRFSVAEGGEVFADLAGASCDAEAISYYRDDDSDPWLISVISSAEPDADQLAQALKAAAEITGVSCPEPMIIAIPPRDWLAENRAAFPPLAIASFWIYGSHVDDPVPDGRIGLKIDAGQAFGSGTHATTHGCLTLLERYLDRSTALRIADIGCGSGILAMAAAKLNPLARIIAVDHDAIAVTVAEDNCQLNGVDGLIRCGLSDGYGAALVKAAGPFDLILANILPSPLMEMAEDAAAHLAEDGVLIVSGLMEQHVEAVSASHRQAGLSLVDSMVFHEWATLVFGHQPEAR